MSDGFEDLIPAKKPSAGGFDDLIPSAPRPEPTGGAAFGMYPKQRATPSRPETKAAVQQASEKMADVMGFTVPEEPEMSPEAVGLSAGMGAAAGRYGGYWRLQVDAVVIAVPHGPPRRRAVRVGDEHAEVGEGTARG